MARKYIRIGSYGRFIYDDDKHPQGIDSDGSLAFYQFTASFITLLQSARPVAPSAGRVVIYLEATADGPQVRSVTPANDTLKMSARFDEELGNYII